MQKGELSSEPEVGIRRTQEKDDRKNRKADWDGKGQADKKISSPSGNVKVLVGGVVDEDEFFGEDDGDETDSDDSDEMEDEEA
jgi:hypothetical protein